MLFTCFEVNGNGFFQMINNRHPAYLFVGLLLLIMSNQIVHADQKRVALVIGNSAYQQFPKLLNPVNDATDMAAKLNGFGFVDAQLLLNASKREIEGAITRFGKKLNNENAVGLFYFAGHGLQVDGNNYLIPIGANITNVADVPYEAVDAGRVLSNMQLADNKLNLMILDACRDNPLPGASRSATRGLARMSAPEGSIILYATSPGKAALDGEPGERNGLFTGKLLEVMSEPGLSVYDVFRRTAQAVHVASKSIQTPYIEGVILGEFSFAEDTSQARLIIKTNPAAARVRILNIRQKYRPEMVLKPGRYQVEVTHPGYHGYLEWIELDNQTTTHTVVLEQLSRTSTATTDQSSQPTEAPTTFTDPYTGIQFVTIQRGCFNMGNDKGDSDEKPVHQVCITRAFDIGKYEVTQGQWRKVMGDHLSGFKGDQLPVERVSWDSVQKFIQMLNQQSGQQYRLPTEAEWEYAARADSQTNYPWGNQITCTDASYDGGKGSVCYYKPRGQYRGTQPVGSYQPNAFGLYDTVGNVWEWVQDWYDESYYDNTLKNDPQGPEEGIYRVLRGGSWSSFASSSRSTYRYSYSPDSNDFTLGFRLAKTR